MIYMRRVLVLWVLFGRFHPIADSELSARHQVRYGSLPKQIAVTGWKVWKEIWGLQEFWLFLCQTILLAGRKQLQVLKVAADINT